MNKVCDIFAIVPFKFSLVVMYHGSCYFGIYIEILSSAAGQNGGERKTGQHQMLYLLCLISKCINFPGNVCVEVLIVKQ